MGKALIVSACRTATGKFGKSLVGVSAPRLGAVVVKEAMRRAKVPPSKVEEVIMGNVIAAGLGQNPARQASIWGGVPYGAGAVTVNKVCGSGLKAVALAAQAVRAGDCGLVVAGGMESMSNAPHIVRGERWGVRLGDARVLDAMILDGLWEVYHDYHMGMTGENIARRYGITRAEADEFAYGSQMKASKAIEAGLFRDEIVRVDIQREDGEVVGFDRDECVRPDTTVEKLAKLKPAFKKSGVCTAGNSSQLSDGASAVVVASEEVVDRLGLKPMAEVMGYGTGGVEPGRVMEAPIPTTRAVLKKLGMSMSDIELFEHNEAYATASIAVRRELGVPDARFNVSGGAVALGHPLGCSGARILTTLLYGLVRTGRRTGIATACLGGGNAVTMVVRR
jgi:acetyl-CoA C-acetyltransferase